jgi:integrase
MAMTKRRTRRAFGSIRKLPSGRFQAHYVGPDGRRYLADETFPTRTDAATWLTTTETDIVRETWRAPRRSADTVSSYVERWITQHGALKATTRALYRNLWAGYIDPSPIGSLPLSSLTPDKVRTWHADTLEAKRVELEGKRAAAIKAERSPSVATNRTGASVARQAFLLLRAAMTTAVDDELIRANPCRTIKGAGTAKPSERPVLAVAEVMALADSIYARYRALVLLAAFSGIRFGELAALRRADLNLTPGFASVRVSQRVYVVDGELNFDAPKSRAGVRTVSIPDALARELATHLDAWTGWTDDAFVFTTQNGRVITPGSLVKTWQKARAAIGRPDVRFHDLRHTGQTLAALSGATQAELMQRLGHSTAAASLNYLHATQDHSRAVAQALGQYIENPNIVPLRPTSRNPREVALNRA